jgi:tRNA-dihydrouridine synthase A
MSQAFVEHRLCVAPMMDRTDRHCRLLLRLIAPHARLYTEMLTARAIIAGDRERLLKFDAREHPVALQLGGAEPKELAAAARIGADEGYDEINLNVGCPSDRVQAACFGAALMREPERVADCVAAMRAAVPVPVTVKTRLGVDQDDSYDFLQRFAATVVAAGCRTLIVHARKAWLSGLSPKQNREVPPLDYGRVHRLKRDFPDTEIVINGGLTDAAAVQAELAHIDGVMLGRAAYHEPMLLAELDRLLWARPFCGSDFSRDSWKIAAKAASTDRSYRESRRTEALRAYCRYMDTELKAGTPLKTMTRHLLGIRAREPGGRKWRRALGELANEAAGLEELCSLIRSDLDAGRARRAMRATIATAVLQAT